MRTISRIAAIIFIATIAGCAALMPEPINVGEAENSVIAKRGQPTHRYQDGPDHLLEYMTGPWGQQTYMARIDAQGRVASFEQVLTTAKFATLKVGAATKQDVLRTIGAPSETSYLPLSDFEVWSYPYKENDVWNSLMHVHFDRNGIVQRLMNGPDPRYDPEPRFLFGRMR